MAIKVKQDMIDFIKNQGMQKALKRAGSMSASERKNDAEFLEGVRRLYGANRLAAATKSAPAAKSADAARSSAMKKAAPAKAKSADAARAAAMAKSAPAKKSADAARMAATTKKAATPAKKKSGTTDPFAKFVFAQGRALAEPFKSKPKK